MRYKLTVGLLLAKRRLPAGGGAEQLPRSSAREILPAMGAGDRGVLHMPASRIGTASTSLVAGDWGC
jgi:hypothetical protein